MKKEGLLPNYINFDKHNFEKEFPNDKLEEIIRKEAYREESQYFEFKRELNPKKNIETCEIIMSFANSHSGIIFYGWDDQNKDFYDIDLKTTEERLSNWIRSFINPPIDIEFRSCVFNKNRGLMVLIPSVQHLVCVKGKIKYRRGSHKENLSGEQLTSYIVKRSKSTLGHSYLNYLKKTYQDKNMISNSHVLNDLSKIFLDGTLQKRNIAAVATKLDIERKDLEDLVSKIKSETRKPQLKRQTKFPIGFIKILSTYYRLVSEILEFNDTLYFNRKNYSDLDVLRLKDIVNEKNYQDKLLSLKIVVLPFPHQKSNNFENLKKHLGMGFNQSYSTVIGVDFMVKRIQILDAAYGKFVLQYWSISPEIKFKTVRNIYYQDLASLIFFFEEWDSSMTEKIRNILIESDEFVDSPFLILHPPINTSYDKFSYMNLKNYLRKLSEYYDNNIILTSWNQMQSKNRSLIYDLFILETILSYRFQ